MATRASKSSDPLHLFREYRRTGDVAIRNQLIEHYLSYVVTVAKHYHAKMPLEVQLGDLISAGTSGLMQSIEKFDPDRGLRFKTYCGHRIRGAMLDWARDEDRTPRHMRERNTKLEAIIEEHRVRTGKAPDDDELAQMIGISTKDVAQYKRSATLLKLTSLSQPIGERGSVPLAMTDTIIDKKAVDPADDPNHTGLRDLLLKYWSLSQALLIRLYYIDDLPMSQIGEALGVSESRVSQIHTGLLKALRGRFGEHLHEMLTGRAA